MSEKEIISAVATAIGIYSYGIYLWQMYKRTIRPHFFTWTLWGVLMSVAFAAQYAEKAGPGMWPLGFSAAVTFMIAFIAYFHGEKNITKSDWAAFLIALSAVPAWMLTDNPLWAVIIVSVIDAMAMYPTFRKSWLRPEEESALGFSTGIAQFFLSILALDKITLVTALYPAAIVMNNILLVAMLLWRRRVKK